MRNNFRILEITKTIRDCLRVMIVYLDTMTYR